MLPFGKAIKGERKEKMEKNQKIKTHINSLNKVNHIILQTIMFKRIYAIFIEGQK